MESSNPLLDDYVLGLARRRRPRVCFLPTASGDAEGYVAGFYRAFAAFDCRPADLGLFNRSVADLPHALQQPRPTEHRQQAVEGRRQTDRRLCIPGAQHEIG